MLFYGFLEFDLNYGQVESSLFVICVGGSSPGCEDPDGRWTASIEPNTVSILDALFSADVVGTYLAGEVSNDFSGTFNGLFIGNDAKGLAAGLNFGGEGSTLVSNYISGVALFESTPLTQSDLPLNDQVFVMGFGDNLAVGGASDAGENTFIGAQTTAQYARNYSLNEVTYLYKGDLTSPDFTVQASNVGGFDLDWGYWTELDSVEVFDEYGFNCPFYYSGDYDLITVAYGTPAPLALLTGTAHFAASNAYYAVDPSGMPLPIVDFVGGFSVNLTTGAIVDNSLVFDLCIGGTSCNDTPEIWSLFGASLNGSLLHGGILGFTAVEGLINGTTPFGGELAGFVVGNTAGSLGFTAGFTFSAVLNGEPYDMQGAVLLDQAVEVQQPVDYAGFIAANGNAFGFALIPPNLNIGQPTQNRLSFIGRSGPGPDLVSFNSASVGELQGNALFPLDPDFILDLDSSTGFAEVDTNVGGVVGANWWYWNAASGGPRTVFTDITDSSQSFSLLAQDLFAFQVPNTLTLDTSSLMGSKTFTSFPLQNESMGEGSWGDLTAVRVSLDVDFSTGAISNGEFWADLYDTNTGYSQQWLVSFGGAYTHLLTSNGESISYFNFGHDTTSFFGSDIQENGTSTGATVDGDLLGIFLDDQGDLSIAGGFNLYETGNTANYVYGGFTSVDDDFLSTAELSTGFLQHTGVFVTAASKDRHHFTTLNGGPVAIDPSNADGPVFSDVPFSAPNIDGTNFRLNFTIRLHNAQQQRGPSKLLNGAVHPFY